MPPPTGSVETGQPRQADGNRVGLALSLAWLLLVFGCYLGFLYTSLGYYLRIMPAVQIYREAVLEILPFTTPSP